MSYLNEIETQISKRNFSKLLQLWEEYCMSDAVDIEEFVAILTVIKNSDFAKAFGQYVEAALPLLNNLSEEDSYKALRLIIDLETTESPKLFEMALDALNKKYGGKPEFNERLRQVGLRAAGSNFQGALSNFDLLEHAKPGNFVFHLGGWGTGEVMEISLVREQITLEFENVSGKKHVTFANAFRTLIPLERSHFLARRFADPDLLEKEAKENPIEIVKILLRDLGPKTASEIKDELADLVIPEEDWQKWWQNTRARLKKDTMISSPNSLKDPFVLREKEVSHEDQFYELLKASKKSDEVLTACYNFIRDHGSKVKNPEVKSTLQESLNALLNDSDLNEAKRLQVLFCLESLEPGKHQEEIAKIVTSIKNIEEFIEEIEILAYKKQILVVLKELRPDWPKLFLTLFMHVSQGPLRDYLLKELNQGQTQETLVKTLTDLLHHPMKQPELLIWYFQKITDGEEENIPFADKQGSYLFMESFLILLSQIENMVTYKELARKMYALFSAKRYALVRKILEGSTLQFAKEFLLLASKCHTFSDHDLKILRSLTEVVHPSLKTEKPKSFHADSHTIWTSEEGYLKIQERIKVLGTKEIVDNAKEIEAARALGDLRENAEYKFALERRSRLQGELKSLSDQLGKSRIITPDDIHPNEVNVGAIVDLMDNQGRKTTYRILGPWDADPEQNVLSFQSKLAQSMMGLKKGDSFTFKDEELKVVNFRSIFDKEKE